MFEAAEYIGIVAFAMSGFFVAARNRLDFLGVLISVFLTALGGGILRDSSILFLLGVVLRLYAYYHKWEIPMM